MVCPQCSSEYRQGFVRCADCGVDLVDVLPESADASDEEASERELELVSIFHTGDVALVPVLKSLLDSAAISYTVQGEHAFGMEPSGAGRGKGILNWGVRFLVPRARAEEAAELIETAINQNGSDD